MPELEPTAWIVIALCAFLVGAAKTGIPGVGILPALLMAQVLPALGSTGMLLGLLILGDLFGAGYHRHNAQWSHMPRLLPADNSARDVSRISYEALIEPKEAPRNLPTTISNNRLDVYRAASGLERADNQATPTALKSSKSGIPANPLR